MNAHPGSATYAVAIIAAGYFAFALQLYLALRHVGRLREGSRSIIALVTVFVLCAVTGYLSDYFTPEWQLARTVLHWTLAVATIWLVVSNAGGAVARMMTMTPDEIRRADG